MAMPPKKMLKTEEKDVDIEDDGTTESESPLYAIETLLSRRTVTLKVGNKVQKVMQYLVKWLGYPIDQSTWEPAANLPVDYIDTFELSLKTRALTPSPVSALAEEEGMELFASCHNALCAKIESRPAAFKQCGGCVAPCSFCNEPAPRYCSLQCRDQDWEARHKAVCCKSNAKQHAHK